VLRQNSVRRQVIDLAGLIQRKFRLDGPPPAPPASTASPPLRRSPPCRLGEPGPTPPAPRPQEDADPPEGAQERPSLLGRAVEGVGRLEGARKWWAAKDSRWWSGSSAIRLSPPRIRACGFPALGSSRRLPNAGQGNLARVGDASRGQWEAFQQRGPTSGHCRVPRAGRSP